MQAPGRCGTVGTSGAQRVTPNVTTGCCVAREAGRPYLLDQMRITPQPPPPEYWMGTSDGRR